MAQLIKMQDYISRYEWDMYRYPSQYIRFKQENWRKLRYIWENPPIEKPVTENPSTPIWKSLFKREKKEESQTVPSSFYSGLPRLEEELKVYFLNKLFPFQLKWATSTVKDVSFMDQKFKLDGNLKYFLQRFPDTYLLLYYPIFSVKNTPIDGEIILISPIGIEIIYLLEEGSNANIYISDERTWELQKTDSRRKIISPVIALKRTEKIIQSILLQSGIEFPVDKVVLSRNHHITSVTEPYNTTIIDRKSYGDWFEEKRSLVSPLKNTQLKTAERILSICQTTSVKRPEWEEEEKFKFVDEV